MSSMTGSAPPSGRAVRRVAVLTHGRVETIGPALQRVEAVAHEAGVELVFPQDEGSKHEMHEAPRELPEAGLHPRVRLGGRRTDLPPPRPLLGPGRPAV